VASEVPPHIAWLIDSLRRQGRTYDSVVNAVRFATNGNNNMLAHQWVEGYKRLPTDEGLPKGMVNPGDPGGTETLG
jgi:hypothetical protein